MKTIYSILIFGLLLISCQTSQTESTKYTILDNHYRYVTSYYYYARNGCIEFDGFAIYNGHELPYSNIQHYVVCGEFVIVKNN